VTTFQGEEREGLGGERGKGGKTRTGLALLRSSYFTCLPHPLQTIGKRKTLRKKERGEKKGEKKGKGSWVLSLSSFLPLQVVQRCELMGRRGRKGGGRRKESYSKERKKEKKGGGGGEGENRAIYFFTFSSSFFYPLSPLRVPGIGKGGGKWFLGREKGKGGKKREGGRREPSRVFSFFTLLLHPSAWSSSSCRDQRRKRGKKRGEKG